MLRAGRLFLAENAWQELEVWVLAGQDDLPSGWAWSEIRTEPNPKEVYFAPYARNAGVEDGPGAGRKALAEKAAGRFTRIRQLCPEDVGSLCERLQAALVHV